MIHVLQINSAAFEELRGGRRFELAHFGEESFPVSVGDYLAYNEKRADEYTGRCMLFRVECVVPAAKAEDFLREDCAVIGLRPMPLSGEDLQALHKE